MIDFFAEAQSIKEELVSIRTVLHEHPELGRSEFFTAEYIEAVLDRLGIDHHRAADTGIAADIMGALPGDIRALRTDMDALPIQECTGVTYASVNEGIMHACGHDVHMTSVLGAAMLLQKHRNELQGTVRLLFQPDEENNGGAERLIADGALDGVSAVYGAHVDPTLPEGSVGIRYGKFYAASNPVSFVIHGKSAHGAQPEKGINALYAGAVLVDLLQKLPQEINDPSVVTIGSFHAGTAGNIISDEAKLVGIVRTLGAEDRSYMIQRIRECAAEVEKRFGVSVDTTIVNGYPGVGNSDVHTAHAEAVLKQYLKEEQLIRIEQPTLTTEDVGYLINQAGGSFYHIGTGGEYPLHHPNFLPSMDSAVFAAGVHASILFEPLK